MLDDDVQIDNNNKFRSTLYYSSLRRLKKQRSNIFKDIIIPSINIHDKSKIRSSKLYPRKDINKMNRSIQLPQRGQIRYKIIQNHKNYLSYIEQKHQQTQKLLERYLNRQQYIKNKNQKRKIKIGGGEGISLFNQTVFVYRNLKEKYLSFQNKKSIDVGMSNKNKQGREGKDGKEGREGKEGKDNKDIRDGIRHGELFGGRFSELLDKRYSRSTMDNYSFNHSIDNHIKKIKKKDEYEQIRQQYENQFYRSRLHSNRSIILPKYKSPLIKDRNDNKQMIDRQQISSFIKRKQLSYHNRYHQNIRISKPQKKMDRDRIRDDRQQIEFTPWQTQQK